MKLIVTKDNLKKGLFVVSRVVGVGNPLQVLNNILIKTDEGRIKLSSTNLEIGINTWIGGKVEEEGALTVPAKLVNEYVNNLPTDKVVLGTKENSLNLDSENYHTTIKGLSAEDFPLIPNVTEESFAQIDSTELRQALGETMWAAAINEMQPEISGLFMVFSAEGSTTSGTEATLRLAATDRYRLAERTALLKNPVKQNKEVIIPSRTISELYKLLGGEEGLVEIFFSESQVLFKFNETELISRLIDGQYPDYQQIIPKTFKSEAVVDKDELIHALKATALFAPDSNNISLTLNNDSITVTASSAVAGENTTKVTAVVSGGENNAVFNFRYLLDCLQNLSETKVVLKMINDASPAALVPEGRTNYLYIVMPIKM